MDSTSTKGEDKGKTSLAIYEFDGDTLKIRFAGRGQRKESWSKELAARKGAQIALTISSVRSRRLPRIPPRATPPSRRA